MHEPNNCNECIGTKYTDKMREDASINSYRNRAVICENDGQHYRSSVEAAMHYDVCDSDIRECCAMHLIQSKGYFFRYEDVDRSLYIAYWDSAPITRNCKVRRVDTGEMYNSVADAMDKLGLSRHQVEGSCRKGSIIRKLKTRLEYVNPYAHLLSPA